MTLRIAYVANHDSGGGDDEGAITHALESLGHRVDRLREAKGRMAHRMRADFLLFHHWHDFGAMARVAIPKVFWCFDLIYWPDSSLAVRNQRRMDWIAKATATADLGFLTDGDWVNGDRTGNLVRLTQGADGRIVGHGAKPARQDIPILFTGGRHGGTGRESFVDEMAEVHGRCFHHMTRVYRRDLADLIARSQVVVAPDSPVSDAYWSNRVYGVLGFGGLLLHPHSRTLAEQYVGDKEIVYYHSRPDLHEKARWYIRHPAARRRIQDAGLARTMSDHLYRHRCRQLVDTVKERLL